MRPSPYPSGRLSLKDVVSQGFAWHLLIFVCGSGLIKPGANVSLLILRHEVIVILVHFDF